MVWVFLLAMFSVFLGCGSHHQSSEVTKPEKKVVVGEENNATLLLINAVEAGDITAVKDALAAGGDVQTLTNDNLTLLMVAVRAQQFAMVDLLMKAEATSDTKTQPRGEDAEKSAFDYISGSPGTQLIMNALLTGQPVLPEDTNLPLLEVVEELHAENAAWLLAAGANPNYVYQQKETALIVLLSVRGIEGDRFNDLLAVFEVLVSHPAIDVKLTVRRNCPLKKAQQRLASNPQYQTIVNHLLALGATAECQ